mmetsp:Transcript_17667/g.44459  ORF Transcript_17667/g.44459 Transcript_17667/m.44459 type:complete len:286 (-) Transcript_17667:1480-2337(-)
MLVDLVLRPVELLLRPRGPLLRLLHPPARLPEPPAELLLRGARGLGEAVLVRVVCLLQLLLRGGELLPVQVLHRLLRPRGLILDLEEEGARLLELRGEADVCGVGHAELLLDLPALRVEAALQQRHGLAELVPPLEERVARVLQLPLEPLALCLVLGHLPLGRLGGLQVLPLEPLCPLELPGRPLKLRHEAGLRLPALPQHLERLLEARGQVGALGLERGELPLLALGPLGQLRGGPLRLLELEGKAVGLRHLALELPLGLCLAPRGRVAVAAAGAELLGEGAYL